MRKALVFALFLGLAFPLSATADSLAKFQGGIGVIPVSSGQGTAATATVVNRNIVRGVQPPGQIWTIAALEAEVKTDGSIEVRGKGLLLAGGNGIGGNANANVFATLICDAAGTLVHSTTLTGVKLEPNADFKIEDSLSPRPLDCASPVLLIRNANNQAWFAAGIPDLGD